MLNTFGTVIGFAARRVGWLILPYGLGASYAHQGISVSAAMMRGVRTTVTLEPDIAARLQRLAVERGTTFKATINATLRAGLESGGSASRPYREATRDLGVHPGVDLTKALRLAAELEDEETVRKLEMRK
jgi:hypothetical protein